MLIDENTLNSFDKRFRVNLINSLSGFKSANLIASQSAAGVDNLAMFSSAVHLGADPALMGFVSRPNEATRDTIENIKALSFFTVNSVNEAIFKQAHQTSARYPEDESEFQTVGLTPSYHGDFPVPFVKESQLTMGLKLEQVLPIAANGCDFIIAKVLWLQLPSDALLKSGNIDLQMLNTVAVSGLDNYYRAEKIARLSYAKPDKAVEIMDDK